MHYFGILLISCGLLISCSGESEENDGVETNSSLIGMDTTRFLTDLAALETRIDNSIDIPKEKDLQDAIIKFQDYASIFPNDPKSADYLLRASDLSLTTNQPKKSVSLLNQIIEKFPDYNRMEDVKYNRASHLDFELRDTSEAKLAYKEFIETYPNSPLINDCKSRIENIRYSMEELTEKFLKDLEASEANDLP